MSALPPLPRHELERLPRTALGKAQLLKPEVWRVETPRGPVVVKDARHARFGARWIARWIVARERRVLERLDSLDGVPHLMAAVDRDAIALTFMPGRPLDEQSFRERPRELFEQLLELTERLHALGVFHLDLHQRKNLLLDDDGRLHMVDFGSAVATGRVSRFFLGRILGHVDRQAAYKFLARFAPEELSHEEARVVLRQRAFRRLWPFSPHSKRERQAARARLG